MSDRQKLIPYAGAEVQRFRPRDDRRRVEFLESIFRRQKDGRLLSEISATLGSRQKVHEAVMAWLWRSA